MCYGNKTFTQMSLNWGMADGEKLFSKRLNC